MTNRRSNPGSARPGLEYPVNEGTEVGRVAKGQSTKHTHYTQVSRIGLRVFRLAMLIPTVETKVLPLRTGAFPDRLLSFLRLPAHIV